MSGDGDALRIDGAGSGAETSLELRGAHIALDALLKATGLAHSGGDAKTLIAAGCVRVDGQVERRRACKVTAGRVVELDGRRVRVLPAPAPAPAPVPAPAADS